MMTLQKSPETIRLVEKDVIREPTFQELREWLDEGIAQATDGCIVEADGICEHGHPSWLLKLGLV